jgi:hypothetical protein
MVGRVSVQGVLLVRLGCAQSAFSVWLLLCALLGRLNRSRRLRGSARNP